MSWQQFNVVRNSLSSLSRTKTVLSLAWVSTLTAGSSLLRIYSKFFRHRLSSQQWLLQLNGLQSAPSSIGSFSQGQSSQLVKSDNSTSTDRTSQFWFYFHHIQLSTKCAENCFLSTCSLIQQYNSQSFCFYAKDFQNVLLATKFRRQFIQVTFLLWDPYISCITRPNVRAHGKPPLLAVA